MDQELFLDCLQTFVWLKVRLVVTRRRCWLQQDGATANITTRVRESATG